MTAAQQAAEISRMQAAGITWVRVDCQWAWAVTTHAQTTYDWTIADAAILPLLNGGMNVLITLYYAHTFDLPIDSNLTTTGGFAAFCGAAAAHYGPLGVHYYEVWNEPNQSGDRNAWWGTDKVGGFGRMMAACYPAIHANDSHAFVIPGGLCPVSDPSIYGTKTTAYGASPGTASWPAQAAGATSLVVSCSAATAGDFQAPGQAPSPSTNPVPGSYLYLGSDGANLPIIAVNPGVSWTVGPPVGGDTLPAIAGASGATFVRISNTYMQPDYMLKNLYRWKALNSPSTPLWDGVNVHPYSTPQLPADYQLVNKGWTTLAQQYNSRCHSIRQLMIDNGESVKPLWVTEVGWLTGWTLATWSSVPAGTTTITVYSPDAKSDDLNYTFISLSAESQYTQDTNANYQFPAGSFVSAVNPGVSWTITMPGGAPAGGIMGIDTNPTDFTSTLSESKTWAQSPTMTGRWVVVYAGGANGGAANDVAINPGYANLSSQLISGTAYTALPVQSLPYALTTGQTVTTGTQSWTVASNTPASTSATTIPVTSQTASATYKTNSVVSLPPGPAVKLTQGYGCNEIQQAAAIGQLFESIRYGVASPVSGADQVGQPYSFVNPLFLFNWRDSADNPMGLTRVDGTAKPALAAVTAAMSGGAGAVYPQLSCRVAFASNPFDSSLVWTEIGPQAGAGPGGLGWLRSFTSKRGRERLLRSQAQFQAGTMTAKLDNRDRRFDPTNASGPYWPNVQPEKVIQIGASWAGTFYPIWTGYVDDWPQSWPGFEEGEVALVATDLFKSLAIKRVDGAAYANRVLADGATAYWRLQDPVGATAVLDSSGNNRTAIVSGNVTLDITGAFLWASSTAAELTPAAGSTPYGVLTIPDVGLGSSPTGISTDFWIQTTATSTLFMGAGLPILEVTAGGVLLSILGTGPVSLTGTHVINDGNWHHITIAMGVGSGGCQQYVDGVLDASSATTPTFGLPMYGQVAANGGTITIEELAFYPVQLSSSQAAAHAAAGRWQAQYTGQMFNLVCDNVGVPASLRSVDTGRTYCQADTQDETQTKALSFLQKLEQTEQGQCYVNAGGSLVFEDRYHRYENPNASSVATFGDGGSAYPSEIPYALGGVVLNFDRAELFNDVQVTRRNGSLQEAVNNASVTEYTNRTMPGLSDLMMATDLDAFYCAQWVLSGTAYPQLRVGNLILDPTVDARLWPLVLGLEIGNVVTVNKHNIPGGGSPVSLIVRVEGIEHQVDPPRSWKTTVHLSLVDTQPWFILDDPVMGILDSGARWGW